MSSRLEPHLGYFTAQAQKIRYKRKDPLENYLLYQKKKKNNNNNNNNKRILYFGKFPFLAPNLRLEQMLRLTIVNEEKQNLASIKKDIVKSKNQLKVFPTRFRFLAISVNMGKSSPLR